MGSGIIQVGPELSLRSLGNRKVQSLYLYELVQRDKANLDIFWLRDKSLEDSENLSDPDVLALEIAEDLEASLELFSSITEQLEKESVPSLNV